MGVLSFFFLPFQEFFEQEAVDETSNSPPVESVHENDTLETKV